MTIETQSHLTASSILNEAHSHPAMGNKEEEMANVARERTEAGLVLMASAPYGRDIELSISGISLEYLAKGTE